MGVRTCQVKRAGLKISALLSVSLLAACVGGGGEAPGALAEPKIERLSERLFMVPVARDNRGCVLYRVRSPKRQEDRSIYWRVAPGHFSTDPESARCA
jgi:hypothetical protein